jgi:hypothetical protein
MAGKTLTGIGEDESGSHELAEDFSSPISIKNPDSVRTVAEKSDASSPAHDAKAQDAKAQDAKGHEAKGHEAKTDDKSDKPGARTTDRMPMFATPSTTPTIGAGTPLGGKASPALAATIIGTGVAPAVARSGTPTILGGAAFASGTPPLGGTSTPTPGGASTPTLGGGTPLGGRSGTPTIGGGGVGLPAIDEDKVAEGLKKLRSLDEPLGPIPTTSTTLKEGIPAVGTPASGMPTLKEGIPAFGTPTPVNPEAIAAAAAAELVRSRGTAHGHALAALAGPANVPVSVDDRMKGTLLGHGLHLPDLPPTPPEESRAAEIRPVAAPTPRALVVSSPAAVANDFSRGDSHFFDSEPINNEYEPENRRGKVLTRAAIFLAVVSVFVVVAIAWVRGHAPESGPVEAHMPPPPAPSALDNPSAPAPAPAVAAPTPTAAEPAPSGAPAAAPAAAAPAAVPPPPPVAAAPAEAEHPAAAEAPPSAPPVAKTRHHEAQAEHAPRPIAVHAARPAAPPHEPKPATAGKRGKDEDPDGTLPLTE